MFYLSVIGIAKSIAKWTSINFDEDKFIEYVKATHIPEIQSLRDKKVGAEGVQKEVLFLILTPLKNRG